MDEYYVRIPSSIYKNADLTSYEITLYAFIDMLVIPYRFGKGAYVGSEALSYYMYGFVSKRSLETVRSGIRRLCDKGILSMSDNIVRTADFIINDEEYYSLVPITALQIILGSECKNKYEICYYLIWLAGTRNSESKINTLSSEYLAKLTGLSKKTILSYNKVLEELDIICVERNGARLVDGQLQGVRNKYVLARDKDKLQRSKLSANNKRSLAGKLSYINKNPEVALERYGVDTIQAIYDYCIKYNDDLAKHPEKDGEAKDVGVLEKLLFF